VLAAVFCFTLFSCVSNTSKEQNGSNITLDALNNWTMRGKIGIKLDGKAKSANIEWRNYRKDYTIQIHGAFGLGSAELKKSGRKVTLKTKNTKVSARSPEQLLEQNLGWSMPVSDLKYWIKGLPAPTSKANQSARNEQGLLTELTQNGWRIRFKRYQNQQGYTLPGKIIATHERLEITLIAKSWRIQ